MIYISTIQGPLKAVFKNEDYVDWTQGGGWTGQLDNLPAGPNSSLSIKWMSAESGPPTTQVVYTDNLVAAGHRSKHCAAGDERLAQLEDL